MKEVNDLIYIPFKTKEEMKLEIIRLITQGEAYRIVHQGNPFQIKYKHIKRILWSDVSKKVSIDYTHQLYRKIINSFEYKDYCIFIKK